MESSESTKPVLLVHLCPGRPRLSLVRYLIDAPLTMADGRFESLNIGHWTGFYDWLRPTRDQVIGVRYWPFDFAAFILEACRSLEYVRINDELENVEISFAPGVYDDMISDAQDFGENGVWQAAEGGSEYVVSFRTYSLSALDIASLRILPVDWVDAAIGF